MGRDITTLAFRRTKTLMAMMLTGSLILILYSMLNLQVAHSHREIVEIPPAVTLAALLKTTTNAISEKEMERNVQTATQPAKPTEPVKFQPATIADNLKNFVPQNSAFWNRKMYSLLRELDKNGMPHVLLNGSHCTPESLESLNMNIQDFRTYPQLFQDFIQDMDCRNSRLLIDQPNKCDSADSQMIFLLFAIKSSPANFERRQAIRETWGKTTVYNEGLRVKSVFLLGSSSMDDPNLSKIIAFEAKTFGDLLLWDFQDSFYNLTLKENLFFKWAVSQCPSISFVFKGDDDVFANTPAIITYLQSLEPEKASNLYTGQIISSASPLRDPKVKYYVPVSFYEGTYPPYAGGGGFLFSGSLLRRLYLVSKFIPFFPIDDVYTGMCFKALGIEAVKHNSFQTFDVREQDRENLCVHKDLLLVHQRTPQQTARLWRGLHSPMLRC